MWLVLVATLVASRPARPVGAGYGGSGPTEEEAAWVRAHVGMYVWGPVREKELICYERDVLAEMVARLGARIGRTALGMYPETWRPEYDPTRRTFLDSLRRPDYRALIDTCDILLFTLADGSGRQFEPDWTREHYQRLTAYLLRTYADVPKTFVLGLWEGDHWLTEQDMAKDPALVEKYTQYFAARHEGIAAGRAAVPRSQARVHEMIELVSLDYEGQKFLINRVIPRTQADLYSLSSWGYQHELVKALDFIKSKAPDSPDFGRRNVMVGEAGGPPAWAAPAERLDQIRHILAQARAWGVPYVTWWDLVGSIGTGDTCLRTPAYEGGVKLAPYYWFYRAFHQEDDPLVIEDFEADPTGPPGGDYSEEGYSLNLLGGRRDMAGDAFACLVPGGAGGQRSLSLRFGRNGGGWSTDLLHLDARRFSELRVAVRGRAQATISLTDGQGRTAAARLPIDHQAPAWRREALALTQFPWIDLGDLVRWAVDSESAGELWMDDLAFARAGSRSGAPAQCQIPLPRAAHILLKSSPQPLPLPAEGNDRLSWLRLIPARRLSHPTLTDGATTVSLAKELLPGQVVEFLPGGTTHLRFGPLGHRLDVTRVEEMGLSANDLSGHPQYHSLQPGGEGTNCWLQWRWESDFPVRHFRIALYGSYRQEWQAHAAILVSGDGQNWIDSTAGRRNWDEGAWIGRTPPNFPPTRCFWVRFQLSPDRSREDWPWTIGLSDFKVELWLDTEGVELPRLEGLRYRDEDPTDGFRGLLDLDW